MLQDTVLVGGFAFLVSGGIIWVLLKKVEASKMSTRAKRMANYGLLACLIAVAVLVIDWHSTNYKANYGNDGASLIDSPSLMLSRLG